MKNIVVATKNKHKLREYEDILVPHGFDVFSLFDFPLDEPEETGRDFLENALIKARALRRATKEPVIADDSGLEVFALDARPGVMSKRYAKEGSDRANNEKLLAEMQHHHDRRARFVTVIALLEKDGTHRFFSGELHGYIHTETAGETGFGYDPLFIPVGHTRTLAELGSRMKNKISHRARALQKLLDHFAKGESP